MGGVSEPLMWNRRTPASLVPRELYVVCTCAWAQVSGDADFDAAHDDGDGGGGGDDNRVPITGGTPYLTAGAWLAIGLGMHVVACGLLYEVSVASGSSEGNMLESASPSPLGGATTAAARWRRGPLKCAQSASADMA